MRQHFRPSIGIISLALVLVAVFTACVGNEESPSTVTPGTVPASAQATAPTGSQQPAESPGTESSPAVPTTATPATVQAASQQSETPVSTTPGTAPDANPARTQSDEFPEPQPVPSIPSTATPSLVPYAVEAVTPAATTGQVPTIVPTPDLATMIEAVIEGVVRIETPAGTGSGIIFDTTIDHAALILTNHHVIENASNINVLVDDTITYRGHVQGFNRDIDLAVISICCGDFRILRFAGAADLKPGGEVITIGYPSGVPGAATVTRGIVSAIRNNGSFEVIQTDAPINPGNSGGPLLSLDGKVLGVNSFSLRDTEGLGFAISERSIRAVLAEISGSGNLAVATTSTPKPSPTAAQRPTATPPVQGVDYFTLGSSKEDVLGVQGSPTKVVSILEGAVSGLPEDFPKHWFYGESLVHFSSNDPNGFVIGWTNKESNLKVHLLPETRTSGTPGYFTRGSSQTDVLHEQGTPTEVHIFLILRSIEWAYGESRIWFTLPASWVLDEEGNWMSGSLEDQSGQVTEWKNSGNLNVR